MRTSRAFAIRAQGAIWTRSEREMALRAVAIADESMAAMLRAHCRPATHLADVRDCLRPCGEDGKQVHRVDQAGRALLEAFTWLYDRGLARIVTDADGDQVIVLTKGE